MRIEDQYELRLKEEICKISPSVSDNPEKLSEVDRNGGLVILAILLSHACQATHDAAIAAALKRISRVSGPWLESNLPNIIDKQLTLEDDWEYRRLLELLKAYAPRLLAQYVKVGIESKNLDVQEAARDY